MKFDWPENAKGRLRRELISARHDAHTSDLFSDDGLAQLLDAYPREHLGIYRFPPHAEGRVHALHGEAPELSGAELLQAVEEGAIWLNLRSVNSVLPEYEEVAKTLFRQLDAATGERTLKRDVGVLISSPNIHVHYHLDIPMVCLVQIRGEKTLHLYPPTDPFAPADQIEAVALKEREEDIAFENDFDAWATRIDLKPGMAITWPQNAPHRVQNGDMLNVSLSCEYMTAPGLVRANAIYANGVLRRRFDRTPAPLKRGAGMVAKAGLARVFKLRKRPSEKGPTPITFRLNAETLKPEDTPPKQKSATELRFELLTPADLPAGAAQQWEALCASDNNWGSPLLSPEFAKLIGAARADTRCALAWKDETLIAAMAVHVRPGGLCRPVGAPFDDCSGPVIAPGTSLTVEGLVKGCGLHAYRASSSAAPVSALPGAPPPEDAYVIKLNGRTSEEYLEEHRAQSPKRLKNFRRLMRKFELEQAPLELRWGTPDPERLALLNAWKSEQFDATGMIDLTNASQSKLVLGAVATTPSTNPETLGGYMVELLCDGKLIAGHFGVRSGTYFHPWISAYDPKYSAYAPGILLLYKIASQLDQMGLEAYDLADGHEHYKKYFAEPLRQTRSVAVSSGSWRAKLQKAGHRSWGWVGAKDSASAAARLQRRFDHIAVCEEGIIARAKQVGFAFKKRANKPQTD